VALNTSTSFPASIFYNITALDRRTNCFWRDNSSLNVSSSQSRQRRGTLMDVPEITAHCRKIIVQKSDLDLSLSYEYLNVCCHFLAFWK
jgi:hypothetical protein